MATQAPNMDYTTRGYRNNNPLNIRFNKANDWDGKLLPNTDGVFEQFKDMKYGYRAAYILIRNHVRKGAKTIAELISVWAPTNENDTTNYINTVCNLTGYMPGDIIDPNDSEQMQNLVAAMSQFENGISIPVPMDAVYEGWELYKS